MRQSVPTESPDNLNVVSLDNLLNPVPLYHRLRTSNPVYWCEPAKAWFLTRHEDVARGFRDPRLSNVRIETSAAQKLGGNTAIASDYLRVVRDMMHNKDGADHARPRKQANQGFTQALVESWVPTVRQVVGELLDAVQPRGHMDLVTDVAGPMPSRMMAEIFAIPLEDRARFQSWADPITSFFGAPLGDVQVAARRANEAMVDLEGYFLKLIDERRHHPGADLLSHLLRYQEEGKMSSSELMSNLALILIAGHTTTIDQLSNGVHDLLTHPDQLDLLRKRPELLKSALDEILRYSPSLPFIYRVVTEDMELGGHTLRKGQIVFFGLAAANRDPEVFPDPDRFDILREGGAHKLLSWGYGPHLCLGRGLARLELEIALEALLRRMPRLALDPRQPPRPKIESLVFRGFHSLPLVF